VGRPTLLCAVAVALTVQAGYAATYYVAPEGNDEGAGTEADPWETVAKAASHAGPGDTVLVSPGVYHGHVVVTAQGTQGAPFVLKAADDGEVVLAATEAGDADQPGLWVRGTYITVTGFTIRGYAAGGIWVGAVGTPHEWDPDRIRTDTYPTVDGVPPRQNTIEGNTVADCGVGIAMDSCSQNTIRGNQISGSAVAGIRLGFRADHNVVDENQVSDSGGPGIRLEDGASFNVIAENECHANEGPGVFATGRSTRNVFGRNRCHANQGPGLSGERSSNAAWIWNLSYENAGPGIILGHGEDGWSRGDSVVGNLLYKNASGIELRNAINAVVQENICFENASSQLFASDLSIANGGHAIDFNCLFAGQPNAAAVAWGGPDDGTTTPVAHLTVAELVETAGVGSGNLDDDPKLLGPPPECALSEGSPCFEAGEAGGQIGPNSVTPLPDDVPAPEEEEFPLDTPDGTELLGVCLLHPTAEHEIEVASTRSDDGWAKLRALGASLMLGDPTVEDAAWDLLYSESLADRAAGAAALAALGRDEGPDALLAELETADEHGRRFALRAIAEVADASLALSVCAALDATEDSRTIACVLQTLGRLGDKSQADSVRAYAGDADESLALAATVALARLGEDADLAALRDDLEASDGALRGRASRLLGELGDDADAGMVREIMTTDPNPRVRLAALHGLVLRESTER